MKYSYYEVYITALRAFTGMGFPFGADEDAAFMVAWLELNKLKGIELLAKSIKKIDKNYNGEIKLKRNKLEFDLNNKSILILGPSLIDYFKLEFEKKNSIEIIIKNCLEPEFFIPLLFNISNDENFISLSCNINYKKKFIYVIKKKNVTIASLPNTNNIKKNQIKIFMSKIKKSSKLFNIKKKISNNTIQKNLYRSIKPKIKDWKIIEKIANRTFVPESKESRNKGAGGGDAND